MDESTRETAKERVRAILRQIGDLEEELAEALHRRESHALYQISNHKVRFEEEIRAAHRELRRSLLSWLGSSEWRNVVSAPVIYSLALPMALLDLWVSAYQFICFPLYRIPRVDRSEFVVVDRHHLAYLNAIEKLNCAYCGYANGVLAYTREVAARTEQYWCPIKHARRVMGSHARYADFLEYGDPEAFHEHQARLRTKLESGE